MITIHQRYRQTDGRTDRQTTCNRNTALCTKVHRAVKMYQLDGNRRHEQENFTSPSSYGVTTCPPARTTRTIVLRPVSYIDPMCLGKKTVTEKRL